jgi:hypothetical protein
MADAVRIFIDGVPPVVGSLLYYRMRARDTTLARLVFWNSLVVDTLGADYPGPGPLTDVVLQKIFR